MTRHQTEQDCISWLLGAITDNASLSLLDPRARDSQCAISGAKLAELSSIWAQRLSHSLAAVNTLILIPMRVGVEAVSLMMGALQAGLIPILIKPTMPANLVVDGITKSRAGILASPISMADYYRAQGFKECTRQGDYVLLMSPTPSSSHPDVYGQNLIGIYSSGSTGHPKIILHTLDRILLNAQLHAKSVDLSPTDTVALSLPLNFSAGLVAGLFSTLLVGSKGVFVDTLKINAKRLLSEIPVSVCMATPSTVLNTYSLDAIKRARIITVGGDVLHAKLATHLLHACADAGRLYSTYGMTEAGPRVCSSLVTAERIRHFNAVPLGQPLQGVSLILDEQCPSTATGELHVVTPTAMYGYLYDPVQTEKVIDKPFGTVRTGDMFKKFDGDFVFAGRAHRVIVRGGENIYPAYVEAVILQTLDFDEVWITSEKNAALGEVPKAYVVGGSSVDTTKLAKRLRQYLPNSHIPIAWEKVKALPDHVKK